MAPDERLSVDSAPAPSDAELLAAVRGGDENAFGTLWSRHEGAARRLAAQITRPSNVDDLVSESFYRVLRAVKSGGGPDAAFRAYLLSTMRRFNIDTGRSYGQRVVLTEDDTELDVTPSESAEQVVEDDSEQAAAWRAWASLPEASQTLLWHLVIEEETPAQIAPLLGVSANGVASRAVRAKERLRQAFLAQHAATADEQSCRDTRAKLGGYVRNALSARDRSAVDEHLRDCERCTAALAEITDVNQTLRAVVAPIILGGALVAGKYLAAAHSAAAATAGAGGLSLAAHGMLHGSVHKVLLGAKSSGGVLGAAAVAVIAAAAAYAANGGGGSSPNAQLPGALGHNDTSVSAPSHSAPPQPSSSSAAPSRRSRPSSPSPRPSTPRGPSTVPVPPPPHGGPSSAPRPKSSPSPSSPPSSPRPRTSSPPSSPPSSSPPTTPPTTPPGTQSVTVPMDGTDPEDNTVAIYVPAGWQIDAIDYGDTHVTEDPGTTFATQSGIATGSFTVQVSGSSSDPAYLTVGRSDTSSYRVLLN